MRARLAILLGLVFWAGTGVALDLSLPSNAVKTAEARHEAATYLVPVGSFDGTDVPALRVEGPLVQEAWRMDAPGLTSLQMLRPLRQQLVEAGYDILFACAARECGGFDFRFQTSVLPAPDMFVDLLDYYFVSARKGAPGSAPSYVTLLVSRTAGAGYIQVTRVNRGQTSAPGLQVDLNAVSTTRDPAPVGALAEQLLQDGRAMLSDLDFGSGTVALGPGPFASLEALAAFLSENEARRIALVGHTDTVGGLQPNITLSRRRAQAVLERLVSEYGIARGRLEAGGMGYLAPITTNRTTEGRERNRRVEAVLLDTE